MDTSNIIFLKYLTNKEQSKKGLSTCKNHMPLSEESGDTPKRKIVCFKSSMEDKIGVTAVIAVKQPETEI